MMNYKSIFADGKQIEKLRRFICESLMAYNRCICSAPNGRCKLIDEIIDHLNAIEAGLWEASE